MSKSLNESPGMMRKYWCQKVVEAEVEEELESLTKVVDVAEEDNLSQKQMWNVSSVTNWVISSINVRNGKKKKIMHK